MSVLARACVHCCTQARSLDALDGVREAGGAIQLTRHSGMHVPQHKLQLHDSPEAADTLGNLARDQAHGTQHGAGREWQGTRNLWNTRQR